jgi:predicted RNA-binding Zn-ribbon protein involved in translation (DUF1610 family)
MKTKKRWKNRTEQNNRPFSAYEDWRCVHCGGKLVDEYGCVSTACPAGIEANIYRMLKKESQHEKEMET